MFKKTELWSESQRKRAKILFREYPDIKKAYYLSMRLGLIYHQAQSADIALTRLAHWYDQVDKSVSCLLALSPEPYKHIT
ncbi:transposase [Parabacteroides johnsonii]|uniref:transposase n=1 Tax=Parabacteroides johnsonii TaxID=387661 RepID=UPI003B968BEA